MVWRAEKHIPFICPSIVSPFAYEDDDAGEIHLNTNVELPPNCVVVNSPPPPRPAFVFVPSRIAWLHLLPDNIGRTVAPKDGADKCYLG